MKSTPAIALLLFALPIHGSAEPSQIGNLTFEVPGEFRHIDRDAIDAADDLCFNRWQADDGRELTVLYWPHHPRVDRGPMVIASQEEIMVAGLSTKLVRTERFFGVPRDYLVVHLNRGKEWYVIYVNRVGKDAFRAILASARFGEDGPTSPPIQPR